MLSKDTNLHVCYRGEGRRVGGREHSVSRVKRERERSVLKVKGEGVCTLERWFTFSANRRALLCSWLGLAWCTTIICVGSSNDAWEVRVRKENSCKLLPAHICTTPTHTHTHTHTHTNSSSLIIILVTMLCTVFMGSSNISDNHCKLQV